MKLFKKICLFFLCLFAGLYSFAQDAAASTDPMRSNGKIYVVMAVVITIILGLFIYVITLDRKISRLEKKG